jgi:hypothetical protein
MTTSVGLTVLALAFFAAGCSRAAPDATPDGAVRAWLDDMEGSLGEPKEAREAYSLLGPAARANLEERAERASQMQGRRTEPYELFAAGRFGLKFRPQSMKATISGDRATVEVTGDRRALEHATVQCVREGGGWRVEPELPALAPLSRRGDGGA